MTPHRLPGAPAWRHAVRRPHSTRIAVALACALAIAPCTAALWHVAASAASGAGAAGAQELVRFVVNGSARVGDPDARAWVKEIALDGSGRRLITLLPGTAVWASTSCSDALVIETRDASANPRSRLIIVDPTTGDWREHVAPEPGRTIVHTPAVDPSGAMMWFSLSVLHGTGLPSGIWQASLVDPPTSVVVTRPAGLVLSFPAWSPRGDAVVLSEFEGNFLGPSDLVLYNAQGRRLEQLTHLRDAKEGSLSPGTTHLVFSRNGYDPAKLPQTSAIWLMERATGLSWPLVDEGQFDHHPVWSHDGSMIVFVRGGSWLNPAAGGFEGTTTLMTIPARGGSPKPLGSLDYDLAMWPATCVAPEWDPAVLRPEPPPEFDLPDCLCTVARRRLPAAVLAAAVSNPDSVYGWNLPLDPNKPVSPINPRRRCLALLDEGEPYHYLGNPPTWKAGCRN